MLGIIVSAAAKLNENKTVSMTLSNRSIMVFRFMVSNAQGKRHRSTVGAEGTNKGHENAEGMAFVGVRLTAQLGWGAKAHWQTCDYAPSA